MIGKEHIPYGSSYSPLVFNEEQWENDLSLMKEAKLNIIRIGDIHGGWDQIEPVEGKNRLEKLQKFYSIAEDYGLDILISTGAHIPPLWLLRKYPDIQIISNKGLRYPVGSSYHWACIHHPGYIGKLKNYISMLSDFVIKQPNHFGWQITNEIGFPFLPPREGEGLGLYCYCKYCQEAFRRWVKNKYKDLKSVTKQWAWGTTFLEYNSWEDIFPPESMPEAWAGVTKWIDWRLFWQYAFGQFTKWQNEQIKEKDSYHPTSINTFNFKSFDRFGTFTGLDQWQVSGYTDHIGYDFYPGSGNKIVSRPEHNSIFLDHGRSVSKFRGSDFWIHELESGPIGGWVMGPERNTDDADVENYVMECLGHNAKLLLYMPWREWEYQPLHWGALVDMLGVPTKRYDKAKALGQFIKNNEKMIRKANTVRPEIALLESKANAIFFRGVNQEEELFLAQRGAYRAFWERWYSVDFLDVNLLEDARIKEFKLICLPMMGLLSERSAELLKEYVRTGGIVIAFARCATSDQNGWFHSHIPIKSIRDIFGISECEPDLLEAHHIQFNNENYQGWWNRDLLKLESEAVSLATFDDGKPAVVMNKLGKGFGFYIATQADSGYLKQSPPIFEKVIEEIERNTKLSPLSRIIPNIKRINGLDQHVLTSEELTMVFISNYLPNETDGAIEIKYLEHSIDKVEEVWPENKKVLWEKSDSGIRINFHLKRKEAYGVVIKGCSIDQKSVKTIGGKNGYRDNF